jgi:hypothetical protein
MWDDWKTFDILRCSPPAQRKITEATVRTFLLAAALTAAVVTGATAQTYYDPSPRDPPFGKGNPGNDTYHLPNQTDLGWGASSGNMTYYGDPWREPRYRRPQTDRQ